MSQSLSDRERSRRLNHFVLHNPQRSAWALKSWLDKGAVESNDINLPMVKVLHLIVRLDANSLAEIKKYFTAEAFFLLQSEAQVVVTLGDQTLEALVYDFYEVCKEFQPTSQQKAQAQEHAQEPTPNQERVTFSLPPHLTPNDYFSALNQVDTQTLIHVLSREQPQVIALVIAYMDPTIGAQILAGFSEAYQAQICVSISHLEPVSPEWLRAIVDTLLTEVKSVVDKVSHTPIPHLAEIINHLSDDESAQILSELETSSADLASTIKDHMFTFNDLSLMDDRGMQKLLKRVDQKLWRIALRGTGEEIQQKVFNNLSKKAAHMLREDLAEQAVRRVSEVRQAQADIVKIALDMEQAGEVMIDHPYCERSFVS